MYIALYFECQILILEFCVNSVFHWALLSVATQHPFVFKLIANQGMQVCLTDLPLPIYPLWDSKCSKRVQPVAQSGEFQGFYKVTFYRLQLVACV